MLFNNGINYTIIKWKRYRVLEMCIHVLEIRRHMQRSVCNIIHASITVIKEYCSFGIQKKVWYKWFNLGELHEILEIVYVVNLCYNTNRCIHISAKTCGLKLLSKHAFRAQKHEIREPLSLNCLEGIRRIQKFALRRCILFGNNLLSSSNACY